MFGEIGPQSIRIRINLELELIYLSGRVKAFRPFHPLNQNKTFTINTIKETKQIQQN